MGRGKKRALEQADNNSGGSPVEVSAGVCTLDKKIQQLKKEKARLEVAKIRKKDAKDAQMEMWDTYCAIQYKDDVVSPLLNRTITAQRTTRDLARCLSGAAIIVRISKHYTRP
jgi:uncharacterized small protein (DUF1192 family)